MGFHCDQKGESDLIEKLVGLINRGESWLSWDHDACCLFVSALIPENDPESARHLSDEHFRIRRLLRHLFNSNGFSVPGFIFDFYGQMSRHDKSAYKDIVPLAQIAIIESTPQRSRSLPPVI